MPSQEEKGSAFRKLHQREKAFIIPNPWDVGTARMLAGLGFESLATTSAGYAFSRGVLDGQVGREAMLKHVEAIVAATDLPVSADLENGFFDSPDQAAETIRMAAAVGAVGGSIEDATGRGDDPIYDLELAVDRVRAAVEASRALSFTLTLTARAENHLHGRDDLADTIRRLQSFQEAGADVLYAPGLKSRADIESLVRSVDRPVNVLIGLPGIELSLEDLSRIGVKRLSTGSALSRAALGGFLKAVRELQDHGTFDFTASAAGSDEIGGLLQEPSK